MPTSPKHCVVSIALYGIPCGQQFYALFFVCLFVFLMRTQNSHQNHTNAETSKEHLQIFLITQHEMMAGPPSLVICRVFPVLDRSCKVLCPLESSRLYPSIWMKDSFFQSRNAIKVRSQPFHNDLNLIVMVYLYVSSDFHPFSSGSEAWEYLSYSEAMAPCHQYRGTAVLNTDWGLWRHASACLLRILPSTLTDEHKATRCPFLLSYHPARLLVFLHPC